MDDIILSLKFNYDKESYAIYESANKGERIEHERELFCNNDFNSDYFVKYKIIEADSDITNKYEFPLPTYGMLDTFWEEQTNLIKEDKNILKLKWIHQLTQGLKDLHSHGEYYGQLSSQCITIDDQKNIKYSFLLSEYGKTETILKTPYFYLPPEYFNQDKPKENDLAAKQSYDIYAFGILLNGIIQETFPHREDYKDLSNEVIRFMLNDPKNNNYPKKNNDEPFWNDFYTQIIDLCLKIDNRPTINDVSKKLDQIFREKEINTKIFYEPKHTSILESYENKEFKIPSRFRKLFNYNDIAHVLSLLKEKYGSLSDFFDVELFFPSPFKSPLNSIDFHVNFTKMKISNEKADYFFSCIAEPQFKENYEEEEENLYCEIDQDLFFAIEEEFKKSYSISNFYSNTLNFCNLKQFIDYQHNCNPNQKINIEREDILTWFLYLTNYMILLEKEKIETPLLPNGFSSETILVSLLSNPRGRLQFQLSIFPFPTHETKLSKIYQSDSNIIDVDVYSFGVLMFEILSIIPCDDNQKVDFHSVVLNSLYSKFRELNESFNINDSHLHKLMALIERCLTPGDQPTFQMINSILQDINNPIIDGINMSVCNYNYKYCLNNQCMDLERLASIANLLEKDNVHSIISHFMKEDSKDSDDNDDDNNNTIKDKNNNSNNDNDNPFKRIIKKLTQSEFEEDFIDPFNFIYLLYSKDKQLSNNKEDDNFRAVISSAIHPYLQKLESLKEKLIRTKEEYDQKCRELTPSKLNFDNLTVNSAISGLTTIINNWSPLIPHTLIIKVNNFEPTQDNSEEEPNNDNDDDNDTTPPKQFCTLSVLEDFAKKSSIKYKIFRKRKYIKMYFPRKESILEGLDVIDNKNDDDIIRNENEDEDMEEEEEEEEEELEEEEEALP